MSEARSEITADAHGGREQDDPTKNVLNTLDDAVKRQDNLREELGKLFDAQLAGLKDWVGAKLDGIGHEFEMIEGRRQEQKIDTKTAVDAALSAAEKAVREAGLASEKSITKSETAAAEQSKQNAQTFTASLKGVTDAVADIKERVGKIENMAQGRSDSRVDTRSNVGMLVAVAGSIFGFLMLLIAIVSVAYAVAKP